MSVSLLIVEDEPIVAQRVERLCREILSDQLAQCLVAGSTAEAFNLLDANTIDLTLLDLNLAGQDGFDLLRRFAARPAHTIVVSAETTRAIEAFDLGVLDFVAKPFTKERLEKAIDRFLKPDAKLERSAKQIAFEAGARIETINIEEILYFKGADKYSEAAMVGGDVKFHSKPLNRLEEILAEQFIRSHKSFLVQVAAIKALRSLEGSRYEIDLQGGHSLPIGRTRVDHVRRLLAARETAPA
ncbi:MAG: response regulator transcription factor [Kordiimonadaceae bacterium]|nr:response regulator transcription factor [Kordiimonadaceae bacterium]MBO6568552.1 response regulator transcription factor [Kordiimonadaceae bacterium]